jgi:hypothetical protein
MPSHLWPDAAPAIVVDGLFVYETSLVPAKKVSKMLWDCKVTPPYCTCQEGNTIGCISSNDGLDAGVRIFFPQRKFIVYSQKLRDGFGVIVWLRKIARCEVDRGRIALARRGGPQTLIGEFLRIRPRDRANHRSLASAKESRPQRLKPNRFLPDLTARVERVPFPVWRRSSFSRGLQRRALPKR